MTYQEIQQLSQLLAGFIFLSVLIGVAVYAFRPGNRAKFERAASIPLMIDNLDEKR